MIGWLILSSFFVMAGLILLWRYMVGKRRPGYLAVTEYWIYSNAQRIPPTEALMDQVVSKNPANKPGRPSISAREGILFSDIRLQIAIAKREKNPHAFRPDLFEENAVPSAEVLERLAASSTIAKIRYASEVPLIDGRHLQFVTHLTATMARLLRSKLIFDTVSDRFWLTEELEEELQRSNDGERPDLHVRVLWKKGLDGCYAETLGLRKVGLNEIKTGLQEQDMEVLISDIVHHSAMRLFAKGESAYPIEYKTHGDTFVVTKEGVEDGRQIVKLTRRISA